MQVRARSSGAPVAPTSAPHRQSPSSSSRSWFGIAVPLGVRVARARIAYYLAQPPQELPAAIRPLLAQMLSEVKELEHRIEQIERELTALTRADPVVQQLRQIPGIGFFPRPPALAALGPCAAVF